MADIHGLIQHLRSHPNPGSADVSALSARFSVDEVLVHNAVQAMARTAPRPEAKRREASQWLPKTIEWVHGHPALAMLACSGFLFLTFLISDFLVRPFSIAVLVIGLFGVIGAFAVAAISRRARFGLLCGPMLVLAFVAQYLITERTQFEPQLMIGIALLGLMLSTVGAPVAILGGVVWLGKQKRIQRATTRQQMLDRLLHIRLVLEYPRTAPTVTWWRSAIDGVRKHFWAWGLGMAAFMAILQTIVFTALEPSAKILSGEFGRPGTPLDTQSLIVAGLLAVIGFGQFLVVVAAGYLSKTFWRGMLYVVLYVGVSFIPGVLGLNRLTFERMSSMPISQIASSYFFLFVCAAIGVGAAQVEEFSIRAKLRQENDPEALLAEMLELEIALGGGLQESYVLVVDVAGSTAMKKDADPLVAEWTFRSYQELVSRVGDQHQGKVESTAGDGAVLAFPSANQGLAAARALLAAMPEFNRATNRLGEPFVLRIGLHCGEVRGDLNQVQFTRVIDVAAHVEASSPRDGIGMTSVFRDKLDPVPDLEKLAVSVDGFDVYVAI